MSEKDKMDFELYAIAYSADKRNCSNLQYQYTTMAIWARSEEEAYGKAILIAKKAFPPDHGWGNHSASITHIPWGWIDWMRKQSLEDLITRVQEKTNGHDQPS